MKHRDDFVAYDGRSWSPVLVDFVDYDSFDLDALDSCAD